MNHVSLILGMRLSGATYQTFAHNGKILNNNEY
jgi:7-keto-8-aminopelargonate synthetase-like enzyme